MPDSRTSHTGDGSTTQFAVSFPYLARSHVSVTVGGVSTAFTWVDASNIDISPAPADQSAIEIRRTTPDGLVSFNNGAALPESDLNTAVLVAQYQTEEAADEQAADDTSVVGRVTTLETELDTAEASILAVATSAANAQASANSALTQANTNDTRLDALEADNLDARLDTLEAVNADRFAVRGTGVAQTYNHGDPQDDIEFAAAATIDPDSGWDGTSVFTVPATGLWHFTANLAHDSGVTEGEAFRIDLTFSDGQVIRTIYTVPIASANSLTVAGTVYVAAGVTARVTIVSAGAGSGIFRTSTTVNDMNFNAFRVGD